RLISTVLIVLVCAGKTQAQETQQRDRLRQVQTLSLAPAPPTASGAAPFEARREQDSESFGVQQLLREKEPLRPFDAFAELSAFFTSNAALAHHNPHSDAFLVPAFGFEYRRPLAGGFQIEA